MRISPLQISSQEQAHKIMTSLGVATEGIKIMSPKMLGAAFKVEGVNSWEANIIKQHLLSLGTDAAIHRQALLKKTKTSVLVFGSVSQLRKLCQKLKNQPFGLKKVSEDISSYLNNILREEFSLRARNKIFKIKRPLVCGIVNITPDSFSKDGLLAQAKGKKISDLALEKVEGLVKEGADMVDVGGESTRPFAKRVPEKEEIKRVTPAIKAIRKKFKKLLISVDTYKYSVAKEAVNEGADIINDISALRAAPQISSLIKRYKLGCVLMHMKGTPRTMQLNPKYKDVLGEITDFFQERLNFCKNAGIDSKQILLDPGIGFGKRVEDNLTIINELYKFKVFGLPIFLGLSRKSFIGKVLDIEVGERLVGTIAASAVSILKGANILRVHDVGQTKQAARLVSQIIGN
ncbi:MAG: dihydropteroate synthase [Candidatus Omnitrophota bacterium]|nr:MAG: dihydropteroate synthase [Candidatus Omnitrophota bacterium]